MLVILPLLFMQYYVNVILPLALPGTFTYAVPPELENALQPGRRAVVQFGKRKLYTAIIAEVHREKPLDFQPKDLHSVLDQSPVIHDLQLNFWRWLADYYLATLGDVMQASLPAGLKLESEMKITLNQFAEYDEDELNDQEYLVMEALQEQNSLSIAEVSDIIQLKNPMSCIYSLLGRHCILLEEELKGGFKPVKRRWVRAGKILTDKNMPEVFENLKRAPKQSELLMAFLELNRSGDPVLAASLLKRVNASDTSLKSLEQKEILEIYYDKLKADEDLPETDNLQDLSEAQNRAYTQVTSAFQKNKTVLLHGITSSGKTEIYVRLIAERLERGEHCLYLIPEIALTTQLIGRLQAYFGNSVLVYHSRFSSRDRTETWNKLCKNDRPYLVVGARSALLLPFPSLGLIIVDEEHESSYKQQDPAPRYHARDAALKLAQLSDAQVLLGSATPSYESYYNARQGKYELVELLERYRDLPLPRIETIDLKYARLHKAMHGHYSDLLLQHMKQSIKDGRQIILFQNRRGFSTLIQCQDCGEVLQCRNCDISLTYHRESNRLKCHYCGFSRKLPSQCPACKGSNLRTLGFGTEKLEDDLKILLPEQRIQRMDLDTTRRKNAYQDIIADFANGETDILIGTQMVTKGLDFDNVGLVGIINADALIHFPDFRSHERAFQLIAQVAGRAGRKSGPGRVLIQTSQPLHPVIQYARNYEYKELYSSEMAERKEFHYPPAIRMIRLTLKHKDRRNLMAKADFLGLDLKKYFGNRILGPEFPMIARLKNMYQMEIMLKLEKNASPSKVKNLLRERITAFENEYPKNRLRINFDVDPY